MCLASLTVTTAWTSSISFCFSSSSKFMYHFASRVFPALFWIKMNRIWNEFRMLWLVEVLRCERRWIYQQLSWFSIYFTIFLNFRIKKIFSIFFFTESTPQIWIFWPLQLFIIYQNYSADFLWDLRKFYLRAMIQLRLIKRRGKENDENCTQNLLSTSFYLIE